MSCVSELLEKEAMPTATRKLDLPDGVPPLTSLYMYISGSCNLACRHCWISPTYDPDNSKGEFLKLDYIKKAVREAKPLGLQTVKLTGGEPMLHPQFCEIIDYLDTENISITMETNGTLIDDIMAKYLKTKVNFSFVSVSLDGHNSEIHEKIRSVTGCFQKTMNGISALVKAGIKPQVICSIYQGNSREIENFVQLAETLGCGSVKFNLIQKMGRGDDFSQSEGL
jgi:SynChlorMet cassette radical SAM/SPASM protein ScmF